MAKQINTDLKFTAIPNTSDNTSTTGIGSGSTTFTSSQYNFTTSCKYYLPCGKCDKTGELCTYYTPYRPTYPYHLGWWEFGPTWTSPVYTYTTADTDTNTDELINTIKTKKRG